MRRLHVKMTPRFIARHHLIRVTIRVLFVGGSRGTSPSLDLTFPPTGLSENLGGMERGVKGEREGWGNTALLPPPTGFCLKYHPGKHFFSERVVNRWNNLKAETLQAITINSFKRHNGQRKIYTDGPLHVLIRWSQANPCPVL